MIQTNNLPLKKHEGSDDASAMLDYANDNMDTINFAVGAPLSTLATAAKTLVGAINEQHADGRGRQEYNSSASPLVFTVDVPSRSLWAVYTTNGSTVFAVTHVVCWSTGAVYAHGAPVAGCIVGNDGNNKIKVSLGQYMRAFVRRLVSE